MQGGLQHPLAVIQGRGCPTAPARPIPAWSSKRPAMPRTEHWLAPCAKSHAQVRPLGAPSKAGRVLRGVPRRGPSTPNTSGIPFVGPRFECGGSAAGGSIRSAPMTGRPVTHVSRDWPGLLRPDPFTVPDASAGHCLRTRTIPSRMQFSPCSPAARAAPAWGPPVPVFNSPPLTGAFQLHFNAPSTASPPIEGPTPKLVTDTPPHQAAAQAAKDGHPPSRKLGLEWRRSAPLLALVATAQPAAAAAVSRNHPHPQAPLFPLPAQDILKPGSDTARK